MLNTGLELIGAMAHILNQPILNNDKTKVTHGYGIMQPRVGINLRAVGKTKFTKIYAGLGGTDSYTNAISDFIKIILEKAFLREKEYMICKCSQKYLRIKYMKIQY